MPTTPSSSNPAKLAYSERAAVWLTTIALLVIAAAVVSHFRVGRPVLHVDEATSKQAGFALDLNKAEVGELTLLPGVGQRLGSRIVETRADSGDFLNSNDLQRVQGIGPGKAALLAPFVKLP